MEKTRYASQKRLNQKRKKVFLGDIVNIDDQIELTVVKENDEGL